jgi:low affinity Fe/Cu permease
LATAWFYRFATAASVAAGSAWMFLGSLVACGLWIVVGPFFQWGSVWHLIPTSILTWTTWILVVLIQNTQTRQEAALQRKLDEIIYALDKADNRLIGLEKRPPDPCPPT